MIDRRTFLLGSAATLKAAPGQMLIDTHVHLFASDQNAFPYHKDATYRPPPQPLESYSAFVRKAGLAHSIIVHPEPYQDDHRYLEHCFANEPSPGRQPYRSSVSWLSSRTSISSGTLACI